MKTVLEFGVRGGCHTDNRVIPSAKLGAQLASDVVRIFRDGERLGNDPPEDETHTTDTGSSSRAGAWHVDRKTPRRTWQSSKHFVSLSILDGVARGPAAQELWRK